MTIEAVENYQNVVSNTLQKNIQPSFCGKAQGKVTTEEKPDSFEKTSEQKAPTGKKVGVGIASWLLPGLGQVINGETKKGLAFYGAYVLASLAYGFARVGKFIKPGDANMVKNVKFHLLEPGITKAKSPVLTVITGLAFIGSKIWATIDAVKKAKPDAKTSEC